MTFILVGYFAAFRSLTRRKEIIVIAIVIICDIMWFSAGFHSSVNNYFMNPKTIYYSDPVVNIIEITNWLVVCLGAIL